MKISKELSDAKKKYVLGLFAENITLTNREVQEKVKSKFNQTMSTNAVSDLKKSLIKQDSPIVANETPGLNIIGTETVTESEIKTIGEHMNDAPVTENVRFSPNGVIEIDTQQGQQTEHVTISPNGVVEIQLRPGLVEVRKTA